MLASGCEKAECLHTSVRMICLYGDSTCDELVPLPDSRTPAVDEQATGASC